MSTVRNIFVALCFANGADALATSPHAGLAADVPVNTPVQVAGEFETVMAFGAAVVLLMVLSHSLERYRPWFALVTFVLGLMAAGYGFASGAWPLGLAVGGYAIVHLVAYVEGRKPKRGKLIVRLPRRVQHQSWEESRMSRMFG